MSNTKYHCAAQQRGYRVMLALSGNEIDGVRPGELAEGLQLSASIITRDLANLRSAGLAETLPHDSTRWRLTPKLVQIARAYEAHITRARGALDEVSQRYSRVPA